MNTEDIKSKLAHIKNPVTQATFHQENRWKDITAAAGKISITYDREGISPQDKRVVEALVVEILKEFAAPENITLKTVSSTSADVFKAVGGQAPAAQPAQIKTGHAQPMVKKSVPGVGKVVCIGSGKGGVGKSTFTVNLASSLLRMGKKVGIIDADIYGPSIPMLLGKREQKPVASADKKIIPVESNGLKFLSFGLFIDEKDPVIWRGPMLGGVLNQFLFDADWTGIDYLLIDLPPGTGDIQLSMVQNCHVDGAIIISTPQDVALLDATKGLEMFRKLNLPIVGMVENMSSFVCSNCQHEHHIFGEGGVEKASKKLGVNFLGSIPLELELRTSADEGMPYMLNPSYEGRSVSRAFNSVSQKVDQHFNPGSEPKTGFLSKLFQR